MSALLLNDRLALRPVKVTAALLTSDPLSICNVAPALTLTTVESIDPVMFSVPVFTVVVPV